MDWALLQAGIIGLLYTLVAGGLGMFGMVQMLNWLDRRNANGTSVFSQHFAAMQNDPANLAHYLGMRFIGASIFVGVLFAAFILR